ncbi:MAG TPA: thioredoxin family protein [Thermoanaerobaculia bacterium]|nr:thioredoxin family protein [Thermoanaerobaculia bacterium]
MDRTEGSTALPPVSPAPVSTPAASPPVSAKPAETAGAGSQSRIPALLFWVLGAAILFRVATAILARNPSEGQVGLVRFVAPQEAEVLVRKSSKPALYDFTAAWCVPCHRLDSEGWSDSRIASVVNGQFVAVRVLDREREDGKNPPAIEALQKRYSVTAFPTLIAADGSGRELARMEGYGGTEALARFLEDARQKAASK